MWKVGGQKCHNNFPNIGPRFSAQRPIVIIVKPLRRFGHGAGTRVIDTGVD